MNLEAVSDIFETASFVLVTPQFLPKERVDRIKQFLQSLLTRHNKFLDAEARQYSASGSRLKAVLFAPVFTAVGFLVLSLWVLAVAYLIGYPLQNTVGTIISLIQPWWWKLPFVFVQVVVGSIIITYALKLAIIVSTEWRLFCIGAGMFGVAKTIAVIVALHAG